MKKNRLLNKFKRFSAPLRPFPDFIIIGAQKGGTSSLFSYLNQHPQLQLPDKKEIHFFDNDYQKGISWYRSHFPMNASERMAAAIALKCANMPFWDGLL